MIIKAMMTGGMIVIGNQTSVQHIFGILIMLFNLLLTLKIAPYRRESDDWSSFIACLALTLTLLAGFVLLTNDPIQPEYDPEIVGGMLVAMILLCLVSQIGILLIADCGVCKKKKKDQNTKVAPARSTTTAATSKKLQQDSKTLKEIRLKHGAASAEYQAAAESITNRTQVVPKERRSELKNWALPMNKNPTM